jgi:hypothetical protein
MLRIAICFALVSAPLVAASSIHAKTAEKAPQPACSAEERKAEENAPAGETLLRGKSVYIYNFLDIRKDQYSEKVLSEIEEQLNSCFDMRKIRGTVIRSQTTPYYTRNEADWEAGITAPVISNLIPVKKIIYSNLRKESEASPQYRLIIFPSDFQIQGAWRWYSVKWVMFDVQSNRPVWEHIYNGKHLVLWKESENAEARGRKIIRDAMEKMKAASLL